MKPVGLILLLALVGVFGFQAKDSDMSAEFEYVTEAPEDPHTTTANDDDCIIGTKCYCEITGDIKLVREHQQLEKAGKEMDGIRVSIQDMDISHIIRDMEQLHDKVSHLEKHHEDQAVSKSIEDILEIQRQADILAEAIHDLQENGTMEEEVEMMKKQLMALRDMMDNLWSDNPYAENDRLTREVEELQSKIAGCADWENTTFFRGDQLPLNPPGGKDWCDTYDVEGFGESFTHSWSTSNIYAYTTWFKDPLPTKNNERTQIYFVHQNSRSTDDDPMYRYANYHDFITWGSRPRMHYDQIQGLGTQIYNGSLFYAYSSYIYRYHVNSDSQQHVYAPYSSVNYYQNNYETYLDFKHDETGFYTVTADSANYNKLTIKKYDTNHLSVKQTFQTSKAKDAVCTVFMICGKLYTLDNCRNRLHPGSHHTQYTFDTKTGTHAQENYAITSKFGGLMHLSYNARERVLFGWDNGHAVTYPIIWKRKQDDVQPE